MKTLQVKVYRKHDERKKAVYKTAYIPLAIKL